MQLINRLALFPILCILQCPVLFASTGGTCKGSNFQIALSTAQDNLSTGNVSVAIACAEVAYNLQPSNQKAILLYVDCLQQQLSFKKSADIIYKAIADKPDFYDLYVYLGRAYKGISNIDSAITSFRVAKDSSTDISMVVAAYLELISLYRDIKEYGKLNDEYISLTKIFPDFKDVYSLEEIRKLPPIPKIFLPDESIRSTHPSREKRLAAIKQLIQQSKRDFK